MVLFKRRVGLVKVERIERAGDGIDLKVWVSEKREEKEKKRKREVGRERPFCTCSRRVSGHKSLGRSDSQCGRQDG